MSGIGHGAYDFDVFLSHSSKDKAVVRDVAKKLKADGLKVWFDEEEIQLGDPIYLEVQKGLERARILLLFMSRNAFGSDWATLEHQTILFRDPLNKTRRFIPLLLDDGPIPSVLRQFKYLDWRTPTDEAYQTLLRAFQAPTIKNAAPAEKRARVRPEKKLQWSRKYSSEHSPGRVLNAQTRFGLCVAVTADGQLAVSGCRDSSVRIWNTKSETCIAFLEGHKAGVWCVAVTADGQLAVSGSDDRTLRVWDLGKNACTAVLEGHKSRVNSVAVAADGQLAVSGSDDRTLRVWDLGKNACTAVLEAHTRRVNSVAVTADGQLAVSGSDDGTLRVWDLGNNTCTAVLKAHKAGILCVAVTVDGQLAVSGSDDRTLRVWDLGNNTCTAVLEGHEDRTYSVALMADGQRAVSGSDDGTLRVWDLDDNTCAAVLQVYARRVYSVAVTADGRCAVTACDDGTVRMWDFPELPMKRVRPKDQRVYTNAKVLLTGDSGAGKSGLAERLIYERFTPTASTDGVWATQLKLEEGGPIPEGVEREIWLWDFAGQADYRLIHQLYMDGTDLALLVFDPQKDDLFHGLAQWDNDLTRAAGGRPFLKLLVAGRCDRGGLRVSRELIREFQERRAFAGYHETSAFTGDGCAELCKAIAKSIPWGRLPKTTSPAIFKRIKEEILKLKDSGRVLLRMAELKQVLEMRMIGEPFAPEVLQTVVQLLANAGVVWPLDFGGYVLLQPERINAYAGALVRAVRAHIHEIGCIAEAEVLAGNFPVPEGVRLEHDDQEVVLRAMVETLLKRGLGLKEPTGKGPMLVFPAYFRLERPLLTEHPPAYVRYTFTGALDEVYTTLVVRLHHTECFEREQLWRDAADFKTPVTGLRVGLKLERRPDSSAVITVFLDPKIPIELQATFMKFIHDHLKDERAQRASNVERERFYVCERCHHPLDHNAVRGAISAKKKDIYCVFCDDGHRVLLFDRLEELFRSPETAARAQEWVQEAQAVMDNQSLEQILLGHVQAIAGEAGQIWRPTSFGDWGIDGEIEFKDHKGQATGRRIYLQLKSGNSYLEHRKREGIEIFRIKSDRHAEYWQKQAYPVWLVVRTTDERSGSSIRWMDLSAHLKQKSARQKTAVKQVEFRGEPLTAQTLMALRNRLVPPPN